MMNKIIGLLETVFLFIFSYIVPKNDQSIIFGSMKGRYIGGNPKIYYLYLREYGNKNLSLSFYDKSNNNKDSRIYTYTNTIKKYWYILRAKYICIDACSFDVGIHGVLSGNFGIIQMRHGEPIKRMGFMSEQYISRRGAITLFFEKVEYRNYTYILSNPGTKEVMQKTFLNDSVLNIGVPRNDILLFPEIGKLCTNNVVKNAIQNYRKQYESIILFAPTFRELNNNQYFSDIECQELNDVLQSKNALMMIKTHPNETRSFLGKNVYTNIINVTKKLTFDSVDFLPFVDVAMTDYSSIYIDFLLTNKPVVWYQNDLDAYMHQERGLLYLPEEVVISSACAYTFQQLISIIGSLQKIIISDVYLSEYTTLRELFYGNSIESQSACERLTNILSK